MITILLIGVFGFACFMAGWRVRSWLEAVDIDDTGELFKR